MGRSMAPDETYMREALELARLAAAEDEVRGINRVVYDISSKPPAIIEGE